MRELLLIIAGIVYTIFLAQYFYSLGYCAAVEDMADESDD